MTIRFATMEDIPACVEVARYFVENSRFNIYTFSEERAHKQFESLIKVGQEQRGDHCMILAEDSKGEIVGGVLGRVEQHLFSDNTVASIITYVAKPETRMAGTGIKLLSAFKSWAKNRNAFEINAGINSGIDMKKMDKFLRKLGFEQTGGNYALTLS